MAKRGTKEGAVTWQMRGPWMWFWDRVRSRTPMHFGGRMEVDGDGAKEYVSDVRWNGCDGWQTRVTEEVVLVGPQCGEKGHQGGCRDLANEEEP